MSFCGLKLEAKNGIYYVHICTLYLKIQNKFGIVQYRQLNCNRLFNIVMFIFKMNLCT